MKEKQQFGGPWTEEKLKVLFNYLDFYTTALSAKNWRKFYIDAFAGTGTRKQKDERGAIQSFVGSALLALDVEPRFDSYVFIERDAQNALELQKNIKDKNPHADAIVIQGDANQELLKMLRKWDKYKNRGVIFLDPFAMSVEWETLKAIAKTESLDLWFLVPLGTIARLLPREGKPPVPWEDTLKRLFGETPNLYTEVETPSLFPEEDGIDTILNMRQGSTKTICTYIIKRFSTIFKGWVSNDVLILRNSIKSPIFILIFAISNPSENAIALAKKVVKDILKRHKIEGGDVQRFGD